MLFDCIHYFILDLVVLEQAEVDVEFVHALSHWIDILEHAPEVVENKNGSHVEVLEIEAVQLIEKTTLCQLLHDFISFGRCPLLLGNEVDSTIDCMHLLIHVFRWLLSNNLLLVLGLIAIVLGGLALARQVVVVFLDNVEAPELLDPPGRQCRPRAAIDTQE